MSVKNKSVYKGQGIFWGLTLILAALLIILDSFGTGMGILSGIPVIRIILGVLCVAWFVSELVKLEISHIFFPLAFIFILFEKEIAKALNFKSDEIMSNWTVLVCTLLLTIGTSLIFKTRIRESKNSNDSSEYSRNHLDNYTKYFDAQNSEYYLKNSMGKTEVYFNNIDKYLGNGTLNVENNMGEVVINVSSEWHIIADIENHLGSVNVPNSNINGKVLKIIGKNQLGSITIRYI